MRYAKSILVVILIVLTPFMYQMDEVPSWLVYIQGAISASTIGIGFIEDSKFDKLKSEIEEMKKND